MENTCRVKWISNGFVQADERVWRFDPDFSPAIVLNDGSRIGFSQALRVEEQRISTGLGPVRSVTYAGFPGREGLSFETRVLLNAGTGAVDCTFVPLCLDGLSVREVCWPPPLLADGDGCYAALPTMQGQLLPWDWPQAIGDRLPFDGQMGSVSAYLPWWGEIAPDGGYLCYVRQSWDSAYAVRHPAGGPTRIHARHLPSLGQMRYARTLSYFFVPAGSTYVTLCRLYRAIADTEGRPRTLREKAAANPRVNKLARCCVMHADGKTHISPDSAYYNREEPEKNDRLVPFHHWTKRARKLRALGVDALYLHLDGWGQPGYDNQHPDYLPPCAELGGWEGLQELSDAMEKLGFMLGLHDQYRDYYFDAATYDRDNAALRPDGSLFSQARWAGGWQTFLCASLAPDYVARNFQQLFAHGIHLEAAYLDVFTCNELDECANPRHPMTRRECIDYRNRCFHYLSAHGVLPSSEEVNDWAVGSQVFCHWAPYAAQCAIPVPLYNLVYHDCVLIPWRLEKGAYGIPQGTTGFLHALLNGGMGYLSDTLEGEALSINIAQCRVLQNLGRHVAMEKMVDHQFLTPDRSVQKTVFADGTQVTVNFAQNTYDIRYGAAENEKA